MEYTVGGKMICCSREPREQGNLTEIIGDKNYEYIQTLPLERWVILLPEDYGKIPSFQVFNLEKTDILYPEIESISDIEVILNFIPASSGVVIFN